MEMMCVFPPSPAIRQIASSKISKPPLLCTCSLYRNNFSEESGLPNRVYLVLSSPWVNSLASADQKVRFVSCSLDLFGWATVHSSVQGSNGYKGLSTRGSD